MVIVISSVLTLIAVGSYSGFRKARLVRTGAESLNSAFVAARSYAISGNQWYRVVMQFRNPVTGDEEYSYWVDELPPNPNPSDPPNPYDLRDVPARRMKVTTPEFLQPGLKIADVTFGTTPTATLVQYPNDRYAIFRFGPSGETMESGAVHLIENVADSRIESNYYTIKIYSPTAKSKIFAEALKY